MPLFGAETADLKKKSQKIQDDDIRNYMKLQGHSDVEIDMCIRRTRLNSEVVRYKELLCENNEILDILLEEGWKATEIESALKEFETTSQ